MRRLSLALAAAVLILGGRSGDASVQVRDQPGVAGSAAISGRVEIDGEQRPVRRARVTLIGQGDAELRTTLTDVDGRYRFERLPSASYRVRVEKPGFVSDPSAAVQLTASESRTINVEMQRGAALEGQFLDDRGKPLARLTVSADRIDESVERKVIPGGRTARTDDLGRFRIHSLRPGRYLLYTFMPENSSDLFFPGTVNSRQAAVLELGAGQMMAHLDVTVPTAAPSAAVSETLGQQQWRSSTLAAGEDVGRVTGRVKRSDTGAPIADATIRLVGARTNAVGTASSGVDGRFEFTRVVPGLYFLTARAEGFVDPSVTVLMSDGLPANLEVKAREQIASRDLTLSPPGAVEVRLLDEFGDPAPDVSVVLAQATSTPGLARPILLGGFDKTSTGQTDDLGWFRVSGLPPGDFYLVAIADPLARISGLPAGESRTTDAVDEADTGFATTFFPGTTSIDAATPVRVAVGETNTVTFTVVTAKTTPIVGIVRDLSGGPVANARLMLMPTYGGEIRTTVGLTGALAENGSFRLPPVAEGTYVLQGFGAGLFGSMPVTVAAKPARTPLDLTLTLRPLTTASGRLSFEGDASMPKPSEVNILFQPTDFTSGPIGSNRIASHINSDWTFAILQLGWKGLIGVSAPTGWRLKSIALNGRDITDTPFDFQTGDVDGLEIVMTSRLGSLSGRVQDAGKPVANSSVVVFGSDDATWRMSSRFLTTTRTDAQGAFTVRNLLPGMYFVAAIPSPSPAVDPAYLVTLRPFATPIQVPETGAVSISLNLIKR